MGNLSRRQFMRWVSACSIAAPAILEHFSATAATTSNIQLLHLERNGWVPNNSKLPVILYKNALSPAPDMINTTEAQFEKNSWPPQWVASIFSYHHYHSTAHEVLGCVSGNAKIMLGGPGGELVTLHPGDVALLPTGTGHCNQASSEDFQVVGAYPPGQQWDICREAPTEAMLQRMRQLPFPKSDPVTGKSGTLIQKWQQS